MSTPMPPTPLNEITSERIQQAMQIIQASLAAVTSSPEPLLDEFPTEQAFFELVQRRAQRLETEAAALRRRHGKSSMGANVSDLAGQAKADFAAAGGTQDDTTEAERAQLLTKIDALAPVLVGFILDLPS